MSKKRRDVSKNRYQKAYDNKGGENKGFLDFQSLDKEVTFFKPKEGNRYKIIIIPYVVKSKNHPGVGDFLDIGDTDYVLDIFMHYKIGAEDQDVICLKNYGKACPICEYDEELKADGKEKEHDKIKQKRRCAYNLLDVSDKDYKIKLEVFTTSHYLFEKEMVECAMGYDEDGEMIYFASIKDGKVVQFRAVTGKNWTEYKAFQFKNRPKDIDVDALVDEAISFDELIKVYSYDELKAILYGQELDDNDPDDEESPREKRRERKRNKAEDEYPDDECPHGLKFGKDLDSSDDCEDCNKNTSSNYTACEKLWEENNED